MVLWSYLLLGLPATASLDRVLAPLPEESDPAALDEPELEPSADDATDAGPPARRLVDPGVDELDLLAELERQLTDRLQPAGQLRLIPVSTLPRLPQAATLPEIELLEHPARLGPSALLRYRILENGRMVGVHATSFRVQVLADVWIPLRRLTPGEPLSAADVAVREVDIVRESRAVPADPDLFGRYELARAASPDRALSWSDLAPRALVRKGQLVDVVAEEGMLSINMKGQATRSGVLGEVVTIRNLQSKREFSAEVIDENKVRVHF